jgi:hypothetical protein
MIGGRGRGLGPIPTATAGPSRPEEAPPKNPGLVQNRVTVLVGGSLKRSLGMAARINRPTIPKAYRP